MKYLWNDRLFQMGTFLWALPPECNAIVDGVAQITEQFLHRHVMFFSRSFGIFGKFDDGEADVWSACDHGEQCFA